MLIVAPTGMTNRVTRGSIPMLSRQLMVIGIVAELEPVPKAVANTCDILKTYPYGSLRTTTKKITAIVPKPCTKSPIITVMKYFPSWPMTSARDSISRILAVIKKKTPTGESLNFLFLNMFIRDSDFYLPNDPSGDDHHSFTQWHQEVLNGLSSLAHFPDCCTENNAEHYQSKNVHTLAPLSVDSEHFQWNCMTDIANRT